MSAIAMRMLSGYLIRDHLQAPCSGAMGEICLVDAFWEVVQAQVGRRSEAPQGR